MDDPTGRDGYHRFVAEAPELIEPMNVATLEKLVDDGAWASEIKWDGVRAIAFCHGSEVRLQGVNHEDITELFPEINPLGQVESAQNTILDGELVAFSERGIPSFSDIQQRLSDEPPENGRSFRSYLATFVIFDLLWAEGEDLREQPYRERRRRLKELDLHGLTWQTPDYLVAEIEPTLAATAVQGLEGLVVKRLDSPYVSGRLPNPFWCKLRHTPRQEFVVGGLLVTGEGTPEGLLLGYWDQRPGAGEVLRFAGVVTEGFSEGDLEALADDLEELSRLDSPFEDPGPAKDAKYMNPLRVVEVTFKDWPGDGSLVEPSYLGPRRDKDPGDVRRETPPGPGL